MKRTALYFTAPRQVAACSEELESPGDGQLLVQTLVSAISPGTELLVYRGQFPQDLALDESIAALSGGFAYPLKYGYSAVGRVAAAGPGVDPGWQDRLVFAFHPHESRFLAAPSDLLPVPEGIDPLEAVFLPNMETAVNFVMDGLPVIGEDVVVFGQGIVGLLTTALLSRFPLHNLLTLDRYPLRRQASLEAGAQASFAPPDEGGLPETLQARLPSGADLVYEISGSPAALDDAIAAAGFAGRVVIGSWYGTKRPSLNLGGRFHRSSIRLVSSQVSSLAPEFSARWAKQRRLDLAWEMVRQVRPARWITARLPVEQGGKAYRLLDEEPEKHIQVILDYPENL